MARIQIRRRLSGRGRVGRRAIGFLRVDAEGVSLGQHSFGGFQRCLRATVVQVEARGGGNAERQAAIWAAIDGQRSIAVHVVTVTRPISASVTPDAASDIAAAAAAMSATDSSSFAIRRVAIPVSPVYARLRKAWCPIWSGTYCPVAASFTAAAEILQSRDDFGLLRQVSPFLVASGPPLQKAPSTVR
jgi:hypothetical protein